MHSYNELYGAVILLEVNVARHSRLTNVAVDRGIRIPEGLVVGKNPKEETRRFRRGERGIVLITQVMFDRLE